MKNLLGSVLRRLWEIVSDGFLDLSYAAICLVQLYYCCIWAWQGVFVPMADAPGSRDSAALLIVAPLVIGGALFVWACLAGITLKIMYAIFPNWQHVLFKPS